MRRILPVLYGLIVVLLLGAPKALAQSSLPSSLPSDAWIPNDTVNDVAIGSDGTVYLGGSFSQVGPYTGAAVALDASTGTVLPLFPQVHGNVNVIIPDGSGGWYIGGTFPRVGSSLVPNLVHLLSNGTVDSTWNPAPNDSVQTMVLDGSTLYIGGFFTTVGGQTRNRIAAIDTSSGTVTSWDPNANPNAVGAVWTLAVSGSTVYVGGAFTTIGGASRNRIAAIDASTGNATSWNPNASSGGSPTVFSIAVSGNTVYAGGNFTTIGGATRNRIAALSASTGNATSWNPNVSTSAGAVYTVAVDGNTVYIGGYFLTVAGVSRSRIAAIDATTGSATSWNPNSNWNVWTLAVSGSTVYVSGSFTTIGGQNRYLIAALDASTGLATSWNPLVSYQVNTIFPSGSTVYIGGGFASVGGVTRNGLVALDPTTGQATSWNPNISSANSYVDSIAPDGNTIYVAGWFANIGGQARNSIAALDASTGNATSWNPDADDEVKIVSVNGSNVYAAGYFTSVGGASRNRIAALDKTTGNATSWNPNADDYVGTLAISDNTVYVGGDFGNIGGQARNSIAALDMTTGNATSWNPSADNSVLSLTVSGSTVYAGGAFISIGGQSRNFIAALDASTGNATSWNPNSSAVVNVITLSGSTAYVGLSGIGPVIGGQSRSGIAALDLSTGNATSWDPSLTSGSVYDIVVGESAIHVAGDFGITGSGSTRTTKGRYAAFTLPNVPLPTVSFSTSSQSSASESGTLTVTVTLSRTTSRTVTVPITVRGWATGSGTDYTLSSTTVTIPPGSTSATVTITLADDSDSESNENIIITLGTPTNATKSPTQYTHTITITDDDTSTDTEELEEEGETGAGRTTTDVAGENCTVTCTNFITDENCGSGTTDSSGNFSLDFDSTAAQDPEDSTKLRIVITGTCGSSVTIEKYFESDFSETTQMFSAGDADINETLSLQSLKAAGTSAIASESFRPDCYNKFMASLYSSSSDQESGMSKTLGVLTRVMKCFMAVGASPRDYGFENWPSLIAKFNSSEVTSTQIAALAVGSAARCGFSASTVEEKLDEAKDALAGLNEFATTHIAEDATTCEKVVTDADEKKAWVGVTKALQFEQIQDSSGFQEMGSSIAQFMDTARTNQDYSTFHNMDRAMVFLGAIQNKQASEFTNEGENKALLDMMRTMDVGTGMMPDQLHTLGQTFFQVVGGATDTTLQKIQDNPSFYSNYVATQYQDQQFVNPEDMASSFNNLTTTLDQYQQTIQQCSTTMGSYSSTCYSGYSMEQLGY